jgi:hypothetical protein
MAVVVASIPTFSTEEDDNLDAFIDRYIGYLNALGINPNADGGPPTGKQRAMGILRGCLKGSVAQWFDEQIVGKNWKLKYFLSNGGAGNIGVLQPLTVPQGGVGLHANSFVIGSPADVYSRDPANNAVTIQASMVPSFDMRGGDQEWERIGAEPTRDPVNATNANNQQPIVLQDVWPHQALSWMRRKLPSILEEKRKIQLSNLLQGSDPVRIYWQKVERAGKLLKLPAEVIEDYFYRGLSPDNLLEGDRLDPELPISKVVDILEKVEKRKSATRLGLSRKDIQTDYKDVTITKLPSLSKDDPIELRRVAPEAIAQEHIDKLLNTQVDIITKKFQEQIQALQDRITQQSAQQTQQVQPVRSKDIRRLHGYYEDENPFTDNRQFTIDEIMGPESDKKMSQTAMAVARAIHKARKVKMDQQVNKLASALGNLNLDDNDDDLMDTSDIVYLCDEAGETYTANLSRGTFKKK